jgi:phosphoribosylanthranilate isomerase
MWIKICGVTSPEDAAIAAAAGADAIGLNFVPSSPRCVDEAQAMEIARAVRGRIALVGVVADLHPDRMRVLRDKLRLDWLQLHGNEPADALAAVLPHAYKAVRVASAADVALADRALGDRVLVDAKIAGALGGTGALVDWALVAPLARARSVILAGGLTPENVADAVRAVHPFGVDVASGTERPGAPRAKDPQRLRAFIETARAARG